MTLLISQYFKDSTATIKSLDCQISLLDAVLVVLTFVCKEYIDFRKSFLIPHIYYSTYLSDTKEQED